MPYFFAGQVIGKWLILLSLLLRPVNQPVVLTLCKTAYSRFFTITLTLFPNNAQLLPNSFGGPGLSTLLGDGTLGC